MIKDTAFYNKESVHYSEKRYPKKPTHYTQFFFLERLRLTKLALHKELESKTNLSLFEIGCADGVVIHDFHTSYPETFSRMVGIDISPGMIDAAREKFGTADITFLTRQDYNDTRPYDVIIEIGVINYTFLEDELTYIKNHLKADGVALISLAGTHSIWDKTRKNDTGFQTFLSYAQYEAAIKNHFTVEKIIPVGIPVPLIWRMPSLAYFLSRGLEAVLRPLAPNLFHEKIYVLRLKRESTK